MTPIDEARLAELRQKFTFCLGMTPEEFVAVIWDALSDRIVNELEREIRFQRRDKPCSS